MSITGISSSILSGLSGTQHGQSKFQQIRDEFKQLAQDLQSGNLGAAQQDFTTLSQNLPGAGQTSGTPAAQVSAANGSNPLAQAFNQLGQDLQSGNLQAARQDFTTIREAAQQNVQASTQPNSLQVGGHHRPHHHHVEKTEESSAASSSQQAGAIGQAFSQLAQTLRTGNLQGAQQAFSALQNDLQQIGGFVTAGSSGSSSSGASTGAGSLNVTV